jgi:hypothetical protein
MLMYLVFEVSNMENIGIVSNIYMQVMKDPKGNFGLKDLRGQGMSVLDLLEYYPFGISSKISNDIMTLTATGEEWADFIRFYRNTFLVENQYREIVDYYTAMFPYALLGVLFAKKELNGTIGLGKKGSIFPSAIRPVTVYATTGSAVESWLVSSVTAGWNKKVFYMNNQNTSTTPSINLNENVVEVVFNLADYYQPAKMFEFQATDESGAPLGVKSYPEINMEGNVGILYSDTVFYIGKRGSLTFDINYQTAGASIPVVKGIEFNSPARYTQE